MPPAGAPRPAETTYDAVASAIESSLDRAVAALGISPATVKREWALAKGWLYRELNG